VIGASFVKDAPEKSVRKSFSQAFTANVVIEHASAFGLLELTEQAPGQTVRAAIVLLSRQCLVLHLVQYMIETSS